MLRCFGLLFAFGFGGGNVLDGFVDEVNAGAGDGGVDWLVEYRLVPAGYVGILGAPLFVEEMIKTVGDQTSAEDVCEGDTLTHEESMYQEMIFQNRCGFEGRIGCVRNNLLVVRVLAEEGTERFRQLRIDFGVAEGHPADYRCIILFRLAKE